jgi:hypothetical protein
LLNITVYAIILKADKAGKSMGQGNKVSIYKIILLISTLCGVLGVYFLYKGLGFKALAWFLISGWVLFGIGVRFLIIMGKKLSKNRKEI